MAITTAMTNSAKTEILNGIHLAAHVYKLALIKTGHAGTYSKATTAAGTPGTGAPTASNLGTDEVAASGTYAAGGVTLTGRTVALATDTGYLDFANMAQITGFTGSADGCMIYNDTVAGKPALYVGAFAGAPIAATAGTFDVTIPTTGSGIIEIT
jgi:hypothetical protein